MKKLLTFFLWNLLLAGLFLLLLFKESSADIVFGQTSSTGSNFTYTANNNYGSVFVCNQASTTVYYINIYCNAIGNDLKLGIYTGNGATKLAETASFTPSSGWNKVNLITPLAVTGGTSYAIVVIGSGTVSNQLRRTLGGTGIFNSGSVTWPNLPSSVTVSGSNNFILNAENNLTSSPTCTPTATPTNTATQTSTATATPTFVNTPEIPWYPYRWTSIPITGQPQAVCAYNNKIWVTINEETGKVLMIDPDTMAVEQTITLGIMAGNPQSIHGAFGYVWTGNIGGANFSRVDINTYSVLNATGPYGSPNMITDDGTNIILACGEYGTGNDMIVRIDPSTMAEVDRIYLGGVNGDPYGVCYTGSKYVVGTFLSPQTIVIVDAATATVVATIDEAITNGPCDITYYGGYAWAASWGEGLLWKINPDTFSVQNVPLDYYVPGYSWVIYGATNGGGYIWTTDYEAGRLHKVRPSDGLDVGWADCSMNPQGIAYLDGFLYTADALNHAVVKINAGADYPFGPLLQRPKDDLGMWDSWKRKIKKWWNGI